MWLCRKRCGSAVGVLAELWLCGWICGSAENGWWEMWLCGGFPVASWCCAGLCGGFLDFADESSHNSAVRPFNLDPCMTHRGPGRHTLPTLTPHGPHDGPRRVLRGSGSAPDKPPRWGPPLAPRPPALARMPACGGGRTLARGPNPWLISHPGRLLRVPRVPCPGRRAFHNGPHPVLCCSGGGPLLRVPGPDHASCSASLATAPMIAMPDHSLVCVPDRVLAIACTAGPDHCSAPVPGPYDPTWWAPPIAPISKAWPHDTNGGLRPLRVCLLVRRDKRYNRKRVALTRLNSAHARILQTVLMTYPGQASSLQGSRGADCDILAANELGDGSGWQQSQQN